MPHLSPTSKRGSALLIVLGLLSFLMISAVAFSISMRQERSAAAAYRRNLLARELLATAFSDARATVEFALKEQQSAATAFDRDDFTTHTVEAMAPFRYPGQDLYGRLIASRNVRSDDTYGLAENASIEDEPIAWLLDDTVMRHIPPAFAYRVYETLENQRPVNGGTKGYSNKYNIDWSAGWKPITTMIVETEAEVSGSRQRIDYAITGRMAWAVVNLSDTLDINGTLSASTNRGVGLTGSEFAFGNHPQSTANIPESDRYTLLEPKDDPAGSAVDLPPFFSNSDLYWYTARKNDSAFTLDDGEVFPYSWENALAEEGLGFFAPFSVYSFWPNHTRKTEDSATSASGSSDGVVVTADEVKAESIADDASDIDGKLSSLYQRATNTDDATAQSFIRLLHDYLDENLAPDPLTSGGTADLFVNAQPTVENVAMVSEVGYDAGLGDTFTEALEKSIKEELATFAPSGAPSEGWAPDELKEELTALWEKGKELSIEIPASELELTIRTEFPGYEEAADASYDVTTEGFVGVVGAGYKGTTPSAGGELTFTTEAEAKALGGSGSGLTADSGGRFSSGQVTLKGESLTLKLERKGIPVTFGEQAAGLTGIPLEQPSPVTLTFLVDYCFRVAMEGADGVVDVSPVDSDTTAKITHSDYPTTLDDRWDASTMGILDAQLFRLTFPVSVTFALDWEVEEVPDPDGNSTGKYTFKNLLVNDAHPVEAKVDLENPLQMAANKSVTLATSDQAIPSWKTFSPRKGTWFTVDPRYNWLSPMMGVKDDGGAYFGSLAIVKNLSSPHWLFCQDEPGTSGEASSNVASAYANAHAELVPFCWGLNPEDIRYNTNDSGQLLLAAELGSLPVPMKANEWNGGNATQVESYLRGSITDYHEKVARVSFFRTLPAMDFEDGAVTEADYARYVDACKMIRSFGGDTFPEEHRALINVFAGQDDYVYAQRMRQLALLGIPPTIKQAGKITYERLNAAVQAGRLPETALDALEDFADVELPDGYAPPKYDTFVSEYLFPLPDDSGGKGENASDWSQSQTLYGSTSGVPKRPETLENFLNQPAGAGGEGTLMDRLTAYNDSTSGQKLGQNDITTLLAMAKQCFGDRQQLFLYILRADAIAYNSGRDLSQHKPLSSARAVALVWRDAYNELPDRVIYYQMLP